MSPVGASEGHVDLLSEEHRESELALRLTNTLLRAVATGDPIRSLVTQLSTLTHGAAIVYDADGFVIERAGEAPAQLIWNEIVGSTSIDHDVVIGRWRAKTRRVALSSETHILAIASRTHTLIETPGELLLDTAERILSTIHGLQYSAQLRERRDNHRVLMSLHDGIPPSREHRYWSRLAQFKFPSYIPLYAFELAPKNARPADESDVETIIRQARSVELPLLIGLRRLDAQYPATVSGIVPATVRQEHVLEEISPEYNLGVSEPFNTLVNVPGAKRSAEVALAIATRRSRANAPGVTVLMEEIDLATWLLSRVSEQHLTGHVRRTLESVLDNDMLLGTLTIYLASGQNVAKAAAHLFIHENTVRYRISKVEEELGVSLSDPVAVTNITLALYEDILECQRILTHDPPK